MRFHKYLKAVGTGPKGNKDLTQEEMKDAMHMVLQGTAIPEQISAFLLGWRVKGESKEELLGAIEALDEYTKRKNIKNSIELGYPLDGKVKSIPIMYLSAKMVSNIPIVIHGDRAQPSKLGFNPKDFKEHIKFNSNIHYFDRSDFLPELSKLTDLRRSLGLRSAFNTIEKLHNVAESDFAIIGMFHTKYFDLYKELYGPKYKRLVIVRGSEGAPEILKKSTIYVVDGKESVSLPIDPADFGIEPFDVKEEMTLLQMVKQLKHPTELIMKYARLNAALLMFATNRESSIEVAFEKLQGSYDKLVKKLVK